MYNNHRNPHSKVTTLIKNLNVTETLNVFKTHQILREENCFPHTTTCLNFIFIIPYATSTFLQKIIFRCYLWTRHLIDHRIGLTPTPSPLHRSQSLARAPGLSRKPLNIPSPQPPSLHRDRFSDPLDISRLDVSIASKYLIWLRPAAKWSWATESRPVEAVRDDEAAGSGLIRRLWNWWEVNSVTATDSDFSRGGGIFFAVDGWRELIALQRLERKREVLAVFPGYWYNGHLTLASNHEICSVGFTSGLVARMKTLSAICMMFLHIYFAKQLRQLFTLRGLQTYTSPHCEFCFWHIKLGN